MSGAVVGLSDDLVRAVHERFAADALTAHFGFGERAVCVERNSGMVEQEAVAHEIERSVLVEHTQMALHLLRLTERTPQLRHEVRFFLAERIGFGRVDGRQVLVQEHLTVKRPLAVVQGTFIQHSAVVHVPLGVTTHGLTLQFELDDGDGFVHLGHQLGRACEARVVLKILGLPDGAGVIAVHGHGEVRQRQQVDAVPLFECFDVGVPNRDAQYGGNECPVTRHRSHPLDIVVAPLDIVVTDGREHVKDLGCARPAVEDVSDDMERVNGQGMNEITDDDDELVGTAGLDDSFDDGVVIGLAVVLLQTRLVQQFADDIGVVLRQQFLHLGTAVLDGDRTGDLHDLAQTAFVPIVRLVFHLQTLVGIIDERTQRPFVFLRERVSIDLVHLTAYDTGGVLDHMNERTRLAVQVGHKMLRSFGQGEDRTQVNQLRDH